MPAWVAPSALEYVPEPQREHTLAREAPVASEKEPAWHCWQVPETPEPSAVENVPASQEMQVLSRGAPDALENFPAAHARQVLALVAMTTVE